MNTTLLIPPLEVIDAKRETPIKIWQAKYWNNIVEQDRAIKRRTRSMLSFRRFRCPRILLGGIDAAHILAKWKMKGNGTRQRFADQFYSLAA